MKLRQDSGSDVSVINVHTWRKLKTYTMIKKQIKKARAVTGYRITFEGEVTLIVILNGITKQSNVFVHKDSENLF